MTNSQTLQIYQDYSPKDENLQETESRTNVLGGDIWYNWFQLRLVIKRETWISITIVILKNSE